MQARSIIWRPLVVAALLALAVAGCGKVKETGGGGGGAEKKSGELRLAVVPKAVGFDFWNQVKTGAECAASKQKDVKVQWDGVTAETDVTGQVNLLQNFITQGVDGIVYAATDAKVLNDVSTQAIQQDIPVVNIDSGTDPQPKEVPVFATDNVASAEKVAACWPTSSARRAARSRSSPSSGARRPTSSAPRASRPASRAPRVELVAEQAIQSDYDKALQVTEDISPRTRT